MERHKMEYETPAEELHEARQEAETLRAELEQQRENYQARLARTEELLENAREVARNNTYRHQREHTLFQNRMTAEREHLRTALAIAHEGKQSFEVTSPEAMAYIVKALKIARLMGMHSEARQLADGLDIMGTLTRIEAETLPQSQDDKTEAIAETQRQTLRVSSVHPLDPRLEAVWKRCLTIAQNAGMCAVYEEVAEKVGIPTDYQVEYEGELEVYISGTVTIPISGTATRLDIVNGNLDYDIDISDYVHELDYSIEDTNIQVVD
jgi:hypothetical protein